MKKFICILFLAAFVLSCATLSPLTSYEETFDLTLDAFKRLNIPVITVDRTSKNIETDYFRFKSDDIETALCISRNYGDYDKYKYNVQIGNGTIVFDGRVKRLTGYRWVEVPFKPLEFGPLPSTTKEVFNKIHKRHITVRMGGLTITGEEECFTNPNVLQAVTE
jgi:hypothetical protein